MIRYLYGRSIFKSILVISVLALFLVFISKLSLFPSEKETNNFNPKIIPMKYKQIKNESKESKNFILTISSSSTTSSSSTVTTVTTTTKKPEKISHEKLEVQNVDDKIKIFSGNNSVRFNTNFNVPTDGVLKIASNTILMKELNDEVKKVEKLINKEPIDFDKNARFCTCTKISQPCICCAKIIQETIGISNKLCTNITYIPKYKAVKVGMKYGKHQTENDVFIDIDNPPSVCLTEVFKAQSAENETNMNKTVNINILDLCFKPRNLTYNVNVDTSHKTLFKGCSTFDIRINNLSIKIQPLGCFRAANSEKDSQMPNLPHVIQ